MRRSLLQRLKLKRQISQIPVNQRFFTGEGERLLNYYCNNACVFGYGTYPNVAPLNFIPKETKGLYFYYGSGIKDLLEEILKLDMIKDLEYLAIGITHNHADDYADYSEISKLLSTTYFPKLKFLEYGVDELVANEPCIYGNLGNITGVLSNMPQLEKLYLYGNFQLTAPLSLPFLTHFEVCMDDYNLHINGGKITNHTLQHIFLSKLESLVLMSLDLTFNDEDYNYTIPDEFLSGINTPNLELLELMGKFNSGTGLQINESLIAKHPNIRISISGIEEPA
jgi:hypothetical protein